MNNNPFREHDIVSILNIDDEDFEFEYNRSEGNAPYNIPAGQIWRAPGFLAAHGLKHLIDKILTKRGLRTNNTLERQKLAAEIVVSTESLRQKREPTEAEVLAAKVKELNEPSDLELLLTKRGEDKEVAAVTPTILPTSAKSSIPTVVETPEGVLPPDPKSVLVASYDGPTTPLVKVLPTKNELLDYAKDKLKMNMDDKTVKNLKSMSIEKLIKELDYSME
jgi:hypothetical protein